jgi:hypothetical protein
VDLSRAPTAAALMHRLWVMAILFWLAGWVSGWCVRKLWGLRARHVPWYGQQGWDAAYYGWHRWVPPERRAWAQPAGQAERERRFFERDRPRDRVVYGGRVVHLSH